MDYIGIHILILNIYEHIKSLEAFHFISCHYVKELKKKTKIACLVKMDYLSKCLYMYIVHPVIETTFVMKISSIPCKIRFLLVGKKSLYMQRCLQCKIPNNSLFQPHDHITGNLKCIKNLEKK